MGSAGPHLADLSTRKVGILRLEGEKAGGGFSLKEPFAPSLRPFGAELAKLHKASVRNWCAEFGCADHRGLWSSPLLLATEIEFSKPHSGVLTTGCLASPFNLGSFRGQRDLILR